MWLFTFVNIGIFSIYIYLWEKYEIKTFHGTNHLFLEQSTLNHLLSLFPHYFLKSTWYYLFLLQWQKVHTAIYKKQVQNEITRQSIFCESICRRVRWKFIFSSSYFRKYFISGNALCLVIWRNSEYSLLIVWVPFKGAFFHSRIKTWFQLLLMA